MRMGLLFTILLCLLLLAACGAVPAATVPEAELPASAPPSPEPAPTPVPTPPPADEAERVLREMSTEQKVFQMLMLCCHQPEEAGAAAEKGVGGLCLFAASFEGKGPEEVRAMTAELQALAPLPLLLAVDEEGGIVCRVSINPKLRFANFDSPRRLYERGGWALVERDAREKNALLLDLGLNVNLAPVVDVALSKTDYIYPRCFSLDAGTTAEFAALVVPVMHEVGVGCVLKHFPGYGGSVDTHTGTAVDERPLEDFRQRDLPPFAAGIEAGADAVLVSHNVVRCLDAERPASLSPAVVGLLRGELGFEGVILCDDLTMGAIASVAGDTHPAVLAAQAGIDLICCGDYEAAGAALLAAAEDGTLPAEQIDASVLRILRWKLSLGLIGNE